MALVGAAAVQAETVTVNHEIAGALADEIAAICDNPSAVTELTIIGSAFMTADDFTAIRATMAKTLARLDLSGAAFEKNTLPSTAVKTAGVLNNMSALTEVVFPDDLKALSDGAFVKCAKLTKVNLPEGVEIIPQYCFNKCTALSDITLPATLKRINVFAFEQCKNLPFTELPEGLLSISEKAFFETNVAFTELPESVNALGQLCFGNTSVAFNSLPEGVTVLPVGTFLGSKVTFATLPEQITSAGARQFENVRTLTWFEIPDRAGLWSTIPNAFFYMAGDAVERTFVCRSMTPPAANTTLTVNGSFSNVAENPNTTFKVPYRALELYGQTEPYSSMNLEAITVPVTVTMEYPETTEPAHVRVSMVVEDVEHNDLSREVIEGEGKMVIGFTADAADNLYVKEVHRCTLTAQTLAEDEDSGLPDANGWETIYSCPDPGKACLQTVEIPLTVNASTGAHHVVFAAHDDSSSALAEVMAPVFSRNGDEIELRRAGATLLDASGRPVRSTAGRTLSLNGVRRGVYLLRTHETVLKLVK